jgi:hypothetical protein
VEFFLAPAELMLVPTATLCGVLEPSEPRPPLSRSGGEAEELVVAQERERLEVLHLLLQGCRRQRDPLTRGRGAEAAGKERGDWWLAACCAGGGGRPSGRESGALLREGRRRDGLRCGWATRGGVDREEGLGRWEGLQR